MEQMPHLANAPIKEAVLDIRISAADVRLEDIENQLAAVAPEYEAKPFFEKIFQVNLETAKEELQTASQSHRGLRADADGYVAHFRRSGFTLSKLAPYGEWEEFQKEAVKLWRLFSGACRSLQFQRVALRYINVLHLPFENSKVKYSDYLQIAPAWPACFGEELTRFFNRVDLPVPKHGAELHITLASQVPENGVLPVILDIEASSSAISGRSEAEIWDVLEFLRDVKNDAFKGSLTKKAMEHYQ